jgi:hypothetical protein
VMNTTRIATLWAVLSCTAAVASPDGILVNMARAVQIAADAGSTVVRGQDGWLFFAPELRSLSVGKFWGPEAAAASRATKPEFADPMPAILDFHTQLADAGIELIFVPVPAKAAIYADAMDPAIATAAAESDWPGPRIDRHHQAFYGLLREQGVRVLDLTPAFLAHRATSDTPLYCRQDTHWAGQGIELAAAEMARVVRDGGWVDDVETGEFEPVGSRTRITGDLWVALGDPELEKEEVRLIEIRQAPDKGEGASSPLRVSNEWRDSPVLLLGDSHCLVFHAGGDMHARGAGLPDHLAAELGFPPDLVAVRGSGATPSRLALLRRRDNLAGKRVVIWCMTVREFTETQGWRKVPVIR